MQINSQRRWSALASDTSFHGANVMQDLTPDSTQLQFQLDQSSTERRFWAKVDKSAQNGCWLWTAAVYGKLSYGLFTFEGRSQPAHRVAWKLFIGPIPDGLKVCHNCPGGDNPACVNPAHMFLGTQKDNIQDAVKKGRWNSNPRIGEAHHNHKLTEQDIPVIRELNMQGVSKSELGRRYGVSSNTIGSICRRKMWIWVE
jgi:hypothetical protein